MTKIQKLIQKIALVPVFVAMAVFSVMALPNVVTVYATGSCGTSGGDPACVQANFQAAQAAAQKKGQTLDPAAFQNIVNACNSRKSIGNVGGIFNGGGPVSTPGTDQGNCSNAVASCYVNEIDTSACTNADVAAFATRCQNGNVDAAGSSACGIDNSIEQVNKDTGTSLPTNRTVSNDYRAQILKACDDSATYPTLQARTDCQNKLKDQLDQCYAKAGGLQTGVDQTQVGNCMMGSANTQAQCTAEKGNWDAAANKCNPPPPQQPQNNTATVNPNQFSNGAGYGGCGQAQTNLVFCSQQDHGSKAIGDVLQIGVNVLSAVVGIAAVGGIAWESMQYARAQDNESVVSNARNRILEIVIGLIVYVFFAAGIQWLLPTMQIK